MRQSSTAPFTLMHEIKELERGLEILQHSRKSSSGSIAEIDSSGAIQLTTSSVGINYLTFLPCCFATISAANNSINPVSAPGRPLGAGMTRLSKKRGFLDENVTGDVGNNDIGVGVDSFKELGEVIGFDVCIDLATGRVDYGPALSGDGVLPRGEFHPLAALHGRLKFRKALLADLASLIWSAY
ncbi:hypothetical protein AgCh_003654 [Apium graveolens]